MTEYKIVVEQPESTVIAEYKSKYGDRPAEYQSEAELEASFIQELQGQGYEYLQIHTQDDLISNLRSKLSELNNYEFSDAEWNRFFKNSIANEKDGIVEKTRRIQEDHIQVLKRDDGSSRNIMLIDKKQIHNNYLQVINQYDASQKDGARYSNRYDVTILVNGLPLVHVELKRRGIGIRDAFNQIDRYQRDSFWTGSGLYEYVQIFVISNGTHTKYYANTTRINSVDNAKSMKARQGKTSNSFEFTSFWADGDNNVIPELRDFTATFFARHTLLNVLIRYCVFTSENMLLVMRPYQITAAERILNKIQTSGNYKKFGTTKEEVNPGGGYIWHTTGSGKTLTSFKAARLASQMEEIDKVLFVVDRKDLDYQTMKEYDRFEKGSANSNTSTAVLKRQLEDDTSRIIITTIQKLSTFVQKNKEHPVYNKRVVIIFDECHRSQFGEMHASITKSFKKYHLFGFTGTPIFAVNAVNAKTTPQLFGEKLHSYTIVDAIRDKNVLPFRIDYLNTMDVKDVISDDYVWSIQKEEAFLDAQRIANVTRYILDHFDQKTYRGKLTYSFNKLQNISDVASGKNGMIEEIKEKQRISGFNAIFAVASVPMAKLYYQEFKKQMAADPTKTLRIATIYSYGANEAETDGILDEENPEDTSALDIQSRDFLDMAIKDYNEMFHTNYSTESDKFQNYYKDVSLRMKNKELDLLIVVNMFLTGFDATTLNTLWVDKNLKMHGLIQAFSRTNRILNSVKVYGNIVCFRNLQKAVDEAISLFGDKETKGIVLIRSFKDYYEGFSNEKGVPQPGYRELINRLLSEYPWDQPQIVGEKNQREFLKLFGSILRMRNILKSFDEFAGKEILTEGQFQDYCSRYIDLKPLAHTHPGEDITDEIQYEIELLKQIEVNIDYILMLVQKYHAEHCQNGEIIANVLRAMGSSPELRSKRDLIEQFISDTKEMEDVQEEWRKYIAQKKSEELQKIIDEEKLKAEETFKFMEEAFRSGEVKITGTDITAILPPMSPFSKKRKEKKDIVIERLKAYFERFYGIG